MIKFAVTARGGFAERALRFEAQGRGWWPFSYTLLEGIEERFSPADEPLLERLYSSLAAGESALKITRRGRFSELDDRLAGEVLQRFGVGQRVRVHDAAASNGITSLELYRRLKEVRDVDVHVSDWYDALWLVSSDSGAWTTAFDADGRALQVTGWGLALSCTRAGPFRYPVNRCVQAWLMWRVVPEAQRCLEACWAGNGADTRVRRVQLFHPECVRESRANSCFSLGRQDLMVPATQRYEVIRIMNALTPRHMPVDKVKAGIAASAASLEPGGLLVLGRSPEREEDSTRVSVYELHDAELRLLWTMNGGYEWPDLMSAAQDLRTEPTAP